ncbi:MAG: hypothetical protein AAF938_25695 [Myxococcota bacterium]
MREHHWLLVLMLAVACECGTSIEDLAVDGTERWYRCAAWPSSDRSIEGLGELSDGVLSVSGLTRLEFFAVGEGSDGWLRAQDPCGDGCLQVVLGGISRAEGLRGALAARGRALVLAGGEDTLAELEGLEETAGLVDLRGVRELRAGAQRFVFLHGGSKPWARRVDACGFDADDVNELDLEDAWLISWMAPRGAGSDPIDRGSYGMHLGDEALAAQLAEQPTLGGVYAYPRAADTRSGGDAPALLAPIAGGLYESPRIGRVYGDAVVLELEGNIWAVAPSADGASIGSD